MRTVGVALSLSVIIGCSPSFRRDVIEPARVAGWLWHVTFMLDSTRSFRGRPIQGQIDAAVVLTDSTLRRKPNHERWAFYRADFGPLFGTHFTISDTTARAWWWVSHGRREFALTLPSTHQIGWIEVVGGLEGDSLLGRWREGWCCGGQAQGTFIMRRVRRFPYP